MIAMAEGERWVRGDCADWGAVRRSNLVAAVERADRQDAGHGQRFRRVQAPASGRVAMEGKAVHICVRYGPETPFNLFCRQHGLSCSHLDAPQRKFTPSALHVLWTNCVPD